jgi:hypothetical protein
MKAVAAVKLFIELHGASRFTTIGPDAAFEMQPWSVADQVDPRPINKRAGWRKREGDEWLYLFSMGVWDAEVCSGFQPDAVAKELDRLGYLVRDGKRLTKQHRIPGEDRLRLITVRGSIIGEGAI